MAAKYNLQATALDFNSDYGRIEEAFMAMGVSQYRVIQTDFLGYRPMEKHDIVYSLGFVEHFENFDEVLDRHLDHVIPGGVFVVMVPNLRFVRKYYAILCDRANL
ncbi:MAG: class I SAM-dependent methyltransferase, partial [Candidatus Korarchaeota archaeon]|nr:class I SAM-dependent methyltransferase [Candidatus Korarchaeota archaeon]